MNEVDLQIMKQKNLSSGALRQVQRVELAASIEKVNAHLHSLSSHPSQRAGSVSSDGDIHQAGSDGDGSDDERKGCGATWEFLADDGE